MAFTRLFSAELVLRKRLEIAYPRILTKYSANIEIIRFERDTTRRVMETASQRLETLAAAQQSEQIRLGHAKTIYEELQDISLLLKRVRVRPYVLGSRRAVELLGTRVLPEGTTNREMQKRRQDKKIPTAHEYLRAGDFENAGRLIEQSKEVLQKVLNKNADYKKVKLSKDKKSARINTELLE